MSVLLETIARWLQTYVTPELLPAYCCAGVCCVLTWVISTPLRNVGWTFAGEVWRVASLNGTLWNDCLLQYNSVFLNDEVRQLRGVAYAYALWGAVFAVPMQVLADNEQRYGDCGRMLRKWWVAAYETYYAYLPDLGLNTACSIRNYALATKDAAVSSRRRAGEVLRIVLLILKFLLALTFFTPMAVYEFVEFVLLGEAGVALALLMMNLINYFEWTTLGVAASVVYVTIGVVTHIWRGGKGKTDRERLSPTTIIVEGLKEVRERAADRSRTETEDLERLRGADTEVPPRYYDAHSDAPVIIDDGPTKAPAAISAELRAAEERSALLRLELAQHPDVRRGRQTRSRGVPNPVVTGAYVSTVAEPTDQLKSTDQVRIQHEAAVKPQ
ncbi:hypothetical protein PF002_g25038 [Phytophthora fragariae]|uniref:Uncharacterized protein n=1 Tax=Phytophthora fragariae TaxID=53985 RepID=A0A6A3WQS5_9STRA|nr:hypothetical protein PF002_g25038 [Phytophthora fragariae]